MGLEATTLIAAVTAVSALAGAGTAIYSSQMAAEASEYNADVAKVQGQQAQMAAEAEASDRQRRARYLLGTQLAASGASGVALEGSPLLAMVDSGVQEDLEVRRIKYKGYLSAAGARSDAALLNYQAGTTRTSGYAQAGTSLLRGAGSTYAAYKGYSPYKEKT